MSGGEAQEPAQGGEAHANEARLHPGREQTRKKGQLLKSFRFPDMASSRCEPWNCIYPAEVR